MIQLCAQLGPRRESSMVERMSVWLSRLSRWGYSTLWVCNTWQWLLARICAGRAAGMQWSQPTGRSMLLRLTTIFSWPMNTSQQSCRFHQSSSQLVNIFLRAHHRQTQCLIRAASRQTAPGQQCMAPVDTTAAGHQQAARQQLSLRATSCEHAVAAVSVLCGSVCQQPPSERHPPPLQGRRHCTPTLRYTPQASLVRGAALQPACPGYTDPHRLAVLEPRGVVFPH
mmetsp:Transcript_1706/g.4950  ORF Transcript_1706/g.4950 Transcript_1706/m.4950 type:complete len:226 (+) Transcript_1706:2466-3143(+)